MRIVLTIYLHSSLREAIVKHCNNLATWNPRQGSYDSDKGLHKTCQVLKRANFRKWRGGKILLSVLEWLSQNWASAKIMNGSVAFVFDLVFRALSKHFAESRTY